MRILLIHPKINYDNMEPLGLLSLATILAAKGHKARVLDAFPNDNDHTLTVVHAFNPELIGYGFESPGFEQVKELHTILKEKFPECVFCAGGIHVTALPEQTLKELPVDFLVIGEAERSFPAVVNRLEQAEEMWHEPGIAYMEAGVFHQTEALPFIDNLDEIPIMDRSLIYHQPFYLLPPGNIRGLVIPRTANVMTSRGCPYACTFCESSLTMGKKIRRRSVEMVMEEVRYLHSHYQIKGIYFTDDTFTGEKDWLGGFCRTFAASGLPVKWGCQSRAHSLDDDMVRLMAGSGCIQVDVGVESGDPMVLEKLKKGETVEQFLEIASLLKKHKIRMLASFIFGAPGETVQSTEKTAQLITRLKPAICQYFTLIPYPGTPLYKSALENNWIHNLSFSSRYSQKGWDSGALKCGLSPEEQVAAKRRLQKQTFFRDHKDLILGWFFYPSHVLHFVWVYLSNGLLLKTLMRSISQSNRLLYVYEVYAAYNKYMLNKIRTKG